MLGMPMRRRCARADLNPKIKTSIRLPRLEPYHGHDENRLRQKEADRGLECSSN